MALAALMSGTAHTAGELARLCRVAPSTMSKHLSRLIDTGLILAEPAGRYRYYRIANNDVAELLEQIDSIDLPEVTPPRRPNPGSELAQARSCYDHIAGSLGVEIYRTLVTRRLLDITDDVPRLTSRGRAFFEQLDIDIAEIERARRPTARACLDWTERQHHLGGGLGAALLRHMSTNRWITRRSDERIIRLTNSGRGMLADHFGLDLTNPTES